MNLTTDTHPSQPKLEIINNWRVWTDKQVEKLKLIIAEMMECQGYINLSFISAECQHSIEACHAKARALNIKFNAQMPRDAYKPEKILKGDMRRLPLHKNGRRVDYGC